MEAVHDWKSLVDKYKTDVIAALYRLKLNTNTDQILSSMIYLRMLGLGTYAAESIMERLVLVSH